GVDRVHTGCVNADENLALGGLGVGNGFELQHFRSAELSDANRFHLLGFLLLPSETQAREICSCNCMKRVLADEHVSIHNARERQEMAAGTLSRSGVVGVAQK